MATCGSNTTWRCHKVVIPSGRLKKQTITAERPLMRGTNGNLCTRRRRRRAQTPGTPPFRALRPRRRGTTEASSTHTKPAANGGGGGQARPGRGRVLPPPSSSLSFICRTKRFQRVSISKTHPPRRRSLSLSLLLLWLCVESEEARLRRP